MRIPRVSLAWLMALVLYSGLVLGSLRYASELWSSALFLALFVALLASILGVVLCRGRGRASWLGFGVFGWGGLALAFGEFLAPEPAPPQPLSPLLLARLYGQVIPQPQPTAATGWVEAVNPSAMQPAPMSGMPAAYSAPVFNSTYMAPVPPPAPATPTLTDFQRVGAEHATFLLALLGLGFARYLYRRNGAAAVVPLAT